MLGGYLARKKIIINPIAKWVFIASFPLAMLAAYSITIFGGDAINTSTDRGDAIGLFANLCLGAGFIAILVIIIQNIAARRKKRDKQ